jgi:hypothetical protein
MLKETMAGRNLTANEFRHILSTDKATADAQRYVILAATITIFFLALSESCNLSSSINYLQNSTVCVPPAIISDCKR